MPRRAIRLNNITHDKLMQLKLKELPVRFTNTEIGARVKRLFGELRSRGINFEPHIWFSDEWFSPDAAPGIAVPFYLGHTKLIKLEEKIMLHAEGAGEHECMKILRHEAGHALDTAFGLRRKKGYRELFGLFSAPYPNSYRPKPKSRNYVFHLNDWYSHAHPAEDFAETFAVWLTPGSRWRTAYKGWKALEKLEFVDQVMREVAESSPRNRSRKKYEEVTTIKRTLAEHYELRQQRYAPKWPRFIDRDLKRIFSDEPRHRNKPSAAAILRSLRVSLRQIVAQGTGVAPYTIDQLIDDTIERCKLLKLRQQYPPSQTRQHLAIMFTVHTMKLLNSGEYEIVL